MGLWNVLLVLIPFINGFTIVPRFKQSTPFHLLAAVDDEDDAMIPPPMDLPGEDSYDADDIDISDWTVAQLKQQLRLRGMKVSGRKSELQERLTNALFPRAPQAKQQNEQEEFPDVTEYLNEEDQGKKFKTLNVQDAEVLEEEDEAASDDINDDTMDEVWGSDARVTIDTGTNATERIIVDALSKSSIEFRGANQTYVEATVIASRDALKPFLQGETNQTKLEERLKDIQLARENETKRPTRKDDMEGLDEGDETGIFEHVLHRDISDWGKYTTTGAQLSAQQVQGIVLLPDVYGMKSDDIIALAEKIAFECQPVIVMIPDLFRGNPWSNHNEQSYEQWREMHDALRVSVDIRAAAACLRETYRVSSVVLWGLCYGGGRALEEALGFLTSVHDVDGTSIGPPRVNPSVVVAWYPTRYTVANLFGANRKDTTDANELAVMGVFAGNDDIPGATRDDAAALKAVLEQDERVVDHMIKVFPGQNHGFAHIGMSRREFASDDPMERFVDEEFGGAGRLSVEDNSDSEVACLLSTAFMETYSRVFLPTVGSPIAKNEIDADWGRELDMKDLSDAHTRDVRSEIQDALNSHVDQPLESGPRIDPLDKDDEEKLMELLRSMESEDQPESLKIADDDDLVTMYAKLTTGDKDFQLW